MPCGVTNTTLTDPIDVSEIEQNFNEVATAFSYVSGDDFGASAAISKEKLNARYIDTIIAMNIKGSVASLGDPNASNTIAAAPIPGSDGDEPWTVVGVSYMINDYGAGNASVGLEYGYFSSGAFQGTEIATINFSSYSGAIYAGTVDSGPTLDFSSNAKFLRLKLKNWGSGILTSLFSTMNVSVALRRTTQGA